MALPEMRLEIENVDVTALGVVENMNVTPPSKEAREDKAMDVEPTEKSEELFILNQQQKNK